MIVTDEFSRTCILVVDGIEDSRSLLAKICLGKLCFQVHSASSAAEALTWLQENLPCLILLDLHLPDMPGLELSRRIRQLPCRQEIPIIGITSLLLPEDAGLFQDAGLTECVLKPFNVAQLVSAIRRLLDAGPQVDKRPEREPEP